MKTVTMRVCIAAWLALSNLSLAEDPVVFQDANLKTAVETKLGITNPTPTDMLLLTYLNANSKSIHSLTGLEYAVNLTNLYLDSNFISTLTPLTNLTQMKYLSLNSNSVSSIDALANMTQLVSLNLRTNHITSLAPLAGATGLQSLYVSTNTITDISVLSGLTAMKNLSLADNAVSEIRPLGELTLLNRLYLTGNPLNPHAYCEAIPLIEMNNPGLIDFAYDYNPNPYTEDCSTNAEDLAGWIVQWLGTDCKTANNWCAGSDLNHDGQVDLLDFSEFVMYWLAEGPIE